MQQVVNSSFGEFLPLSGMMPNMSPVPVSVVTQGSSVECGVEVYLEFGIPPENERTSPFEGTILK